MIQVNIQGMGNEKFKIDIGENEIVLKTTSVLNLKTKIINDKALGINPEHLRLIFGGKQLENEKSFPIMELQIKV